MSTPTLLTAKVTLLMLSIAAYYFTWHLLMSNGTQELMAGIRDNGPHHLPGTQEPLLQQYTGIRLVDYQLTVLNVFFYPLLSGSHPSASLQLYHFAGSCFAGYALLLLEGLRNGNRWTIIAFSATWGLLMQGLSYAVTAPFLLLLHLSTSPTIASRNSASGCLVPLSDVISTAPSMFLGFAAPAILMVLPSPTLVSYHTKQIFIALWQVFPLWVSILQQCCSSAVTKFMGLSRANARQVDSIIAVRVFYLVILAVASLTHLSTFYLIAMAYLLPAGDVGEYKDAWSFSNVFIPAASTPSFKVNSIGEGAHLMMQYDEIIGTSAVLVWALALFFTAPHGKLQLDQTQLLIFGLIILIVTGPIGLAVGLVWARDEKYFDSTNTETKAKSQ